jgi:hypothetical protein
MPFYIWGLVVFTVLVSAYLGIHLVYRSKIQPGEVCPKCGGDKFHRVRRHTADRILGIGLSARRYRCANSNCGWEGVRPYHPHPKNWRKSERRSRHVQAKNLSEN